MMIVESSGRASHLEVLRALRRLMRVLSQGTQKTRNSFWIRWTCITNIFEILTMFSILYVHRFFGNSSQMCCCRLLRRSQMFPPAGNLSQSLQFRWVGLFSEQLNLIGKYLRLPERLCVLLERQSPSFLTCLTCWPWKAVKNCSKPLNKRLSLIYYNWLLPLVINTVLCRFQHGGRQSSSHPLRRTTCLGSAMTSCAGWVELRTRCSAEEFFSSLPSSSLFQKGYIAFLKRG